jgi:peptidoglycan/LPS O-acetylase OafA/YrhL
MDHACNFQARLATMFRSPNLTNTDQGFTGNIEMANVSKSRGSNNIPILRPVMTELDTLRGIAVLMVFVFHGFEDFTPPGPSIPDWERLFFSAVSLGWTGVNIFFVLSGFLITGILLDSVNRSKYYSRFYFRRALRILPAYYLLIAVLVLVGKLSFVRHHTSWAFAGLSIVYLSNITPLLGVPRDYSPLWSLAVEEHFYLIWPAAVRVLNRSGLAIGAALICLCEPILRALAVARGGLWWGPYTWLSADGLALGALLALFVRSPKGSRTNVVKLAGLSAIIATAFLVASAAVPRFVAISLRATCVNYASLSLVAAVLWLGTSPYRRLVNMRFLSFYGFISYGLYLIHTLIFSLYKDISLKFAPRLDVDHSFGEFSLRFVVTLVIATSVAYLSRTTYEEFFLRMKGQLDKHRENPGSVPRTKPPSPS